MAQGWRIAWWAGITWFLWLSPPRAARSFVTCSRQGQRTYCQRGESPIFGDGLTFLAENLGRRERRRPRNPATGPGRLLARKPHHRKWITMT